MFTSTTVFSNICELLKFWGNMIKSYNTCILLVREITPCLLVAWNIIVIRLAYLVSLLSINNVVFVYLPISDSKGVQYAHKSAGNFCESFASVGLANVAIWYSSDIPSLGKLLGILPVPHSSVLK